MFQPSCGHILEKTVSYKYFLFRFNFLLSYLRNSFIVISWYLSPISWIILPKCREEIRFVHNFKNTKTLLILKIISVYYHIQHVSTFLWSFSRVNCLTQVFFIIFNFVISYLRNSFIVISWYLSPISWIILPKGREEIRFVHNFKNMKTLLILKIISIYYHTQHVSTILWSYSRENCLIQVFFI